MKIKVNSFRVRPGEKVHLKRWPTKVKPAYGSKEDYQSLLTQHIEKLSVFQNLHYAAGRNALLLIFQGMDAAGKDGTIRHVMSGVNPQGCQVTSFKHPTATELEHDFLWRTTRELPARGQIGIFNRSYYEEVLIARVHPEILKGEGIDSDVHRIPRIKKLWKERFRSIRDLERHLHRNGTQIVKFFLHLSKEEQRQRFLARIDDPDKNWKLSVDDMKERAYWNQYMTAYEDCLSATSSAHSPWYVIPADDKPNARLLVSQIVLNVFAGFKLHYPKLDGPARKKLQQLRKQLKSKP